jgi:hypothetical protein
MKPQLFLLVYKRINYKPTDSCYHNQDMRIHKMKLRHATLSWLQYCSHSNNKTWNQYLIHQGCKC